MKISLFIFVLFLTSLYGCKNDVLSNQENYEPPAESINSAITIEDDVELNYDQIRSDIIEWFKENENDSENGQYVFKTSTEGSHLVLTASLEGFSGLSDYTVNLSMNNSDYVTGDLDNDKIPDLLINATIEFGASSSSFYTFLFLGKPETLVLEQVYLAEYFEYCDRISFWSPQKIQNGKIYGIATCYGSDDPNCCPSVKFNTVSKLNGEEIELLSKD